MTFECYILTETFGLPYVPDKSLAPEIPQPISDMTPDLFDVRVRVGVATIFLSMFILVDYQPILLERVDCCRCM